MTQYKPTPWHQSVAALFANGRMYALVVILAVIASVFVLGVLHDIDAQSIVAIFSALLGAAIGHPIGNLQGQFQAMRYYQDISRGPKSGPDVYG